MAGKRLSAPLLGMLLSLSAMGQGQAAAAPDLAVVRLGAVVQAPAASAAQAQVNEIMQRALTDIAALGVPKEQIRTAGLTLTPVYTDRMRPRKQEEPAAPPQIVGYRASNTVETRLEDLTKVGGVIDAGVAAGANQIEGIAFELKQDTEQRKQALQAAVAEARAKAEAIAAGMGVRLDSVREVTEGGVDVIQPRAKMARMAPAMMSQDAGAPVEPGQVRVSATVTVQYAISEGAPR